MLQQYAHHYVGYKTKWRAGMYWLWVLLLTIGLSILAFAIFTTSIIRTPSDGMGVQLGLLGLFLLPLPVALIAAGVLVGVRNARVPAQNHQREMFNQQAAAKIQELAAPQLAPIDAELRRAVTKYRSEYSDWRQSAYLQNAEDVGALWHIVHNLRASDIGEAIRCYVQDRQHDERMTAEARAIEEQQRATRVAQMNGIMNAAMQGAMIGTMIDQGNKTRAAMNAPVTVRFEK